MSTSTEKYDSQRPSVRARLWSSRRLRGGLAAFGVFFAILLPTPAMASGCTDTERRNNMTCQTDPEISKCVLGTAGSGAVGFAFGGPLGFLAGVAGGIVGCAVNSIG